MDVPTNVNVTSALFKTLKEESNELTILLKASENLMQKRLNVSYSEKLVRSDELVQVCIYESVHEQGTKKK